MAGGGAAIGTRQRTGFIRRLLHELREQPIQTPHEFAGIRDAAGFGKPRLIVEQQRELVEVSTRLGRIQARKQRMRDIQLKHRLALRRCLTRGRENPAHLGAHVVLGEHEAGRRIDQPRAQLDLG